ncbi:MAG: alpha/beta hydrolase [Agarilytica sp.]
MKVNNLEFNIQDSGSGDALLWGHGLMASMASEDLLGMYGWDQFPAGQRLVRYDARGHGKTESSYFPEDYHWKNLSNDMLSIADELEIDRFIAGGQSMGCATSIYAGLLAPDRVKGMILMNPPTAWETRVAQGKLYRKFARMGGLLGGNILEKIIGRDMGRILPQWLLDEHTGNVHGALDGLKSLKRRTLLNLFKGAALTDLPSPVEIQAIDIPTLILGWVDDPSHPLETATELDRLLPQSALHIAKGYSDFERWPELIREFSAKIN